MAARKTTTAKRTSAGKVAAEVEVPRAGMVPAKVGGAGAGGVAAELPDGRGGRAGRFPEAVGDEICERISQGMSLAAICREGGMPSCQTVHRWREADVGFAARYARAREDGFEAIAHRLREIARGRGESSGDLPRDKLIIDTDLKLLSKWAPRSYGDKIDVSANHAGEIKIIMGGDVG